MKKDATPAKQHAVFLAKFTPEIAARARAARTRMRKRLPGAIEMVYDNYNALVIGYGPSERASDAVFSLAIFPRSVALCFLKGAGLPDPAGLLQGGGSVARHIPLADAADLDTPGIGRLVGVALARAKPPMPGSGAGRLVIKSISAKQRPRRPASRATA
jgi:hypothetical protein